MVNTNLIPSGGINTSWSFIRAVVDLLMCHFKSFLASTAATMITSLKQDWMITPCLLASDKLQELLGIRAYTIC